MTTLDPVGAPGPQLVRELCLSLDNFWFSAHLLDLLHHAGALGQAEENVDYHPNPSGHPEN